MNIFFNSRIYANQSLLNVLFGQQQKATISRSNGCIGTRDTLTISASGKEKLTKSTSGRTHNTSIDSSIDLKSYIASAKKTNQELIENAGTQINAKTSEYMSTGKAFRAALTEKYSKLAAEAKTHSNPENYIHSKYFDKSSEYYETNLTDTERRIAYNYEMQMCRTGKINGVNYQDSLFRGIEVDGDSVDSDKIQFERALVNSQISNILKHIGSEQMSKILDYTDRSTCVLFGDGAGAVLIKAADNMYRQINYTRGDTDVLVCRGIGVQDAYVKMNGNAVFRFAVDVLKQGIDEILKKSDMTLDDIDYIVCHQANERIINHVKKKYPGHEDKFYVNIAEYGNTSAASIPIALDELAKSGCFDKGRKLILAGFGAGLSWSSALIET